MMVGGLTVPAYVILCYTMVHPLIITLWLGFAYTITAVGARSTWAAVVSEKVQPAGGGDGAENSKGDLLASRSIV